MTHMQFDDEKNLRCVDRCCENCAHGDCTHSICLVTCLHPDRDGPVMTLPNQVCDGWKASAK